MTLLNLLSTIAIVIGLAAVLPQLATMLRTRSAAGQSVLGWTMAASVNALMAAVNFGGYHAVPLAAGNVLNVTLCLGAIALVARFGGGRAPAQPGVGDLATGEFWALHEALEHEARRRTDPGFAAA